MSGALESFNVSNIKPIREMIYESMRQAIFDGELKPGDRLVEKDLADKMRVSRTPIREALRKLEAEGLIKHVPRKGVVVRGFSSEDIIEIYSIRQVLEALAITYTIKNITETEIKKLKVLIEEMAALTEEDETEDLFNTSQEFNDILMKSCRMPRLINLINTYKEYLKRFRMITMSSKERKISALKDHREILQAVIDRDAARAKRLVEEHLQKALESYLTAFKINENDWE